MTEAECSVYDAPFPNADYRAATRKFPEMVPEEPDADGVAVSRRAALFWSNEWTGRSMMAVGMRDPVFSLPLMEQLGKSIRGCPSPMAIANGGHFVQEHGELIAIEALRLLA
jgi:pimeloyl-ACP methyl ester carboxylesterase